MHASFTTSNGTNVYNLIDTSTDNSSTAGKRWFIADINGNIFFDTGATTPVPYSQIVTTVDTSNWTLLQKVAVNVTMIYYDVANTIQIQQGYLLPTTLNTPEQ